MRSECNYRRYLNRESQFTVLWHEETLPSFRRRGWIVYKITFRSLIQFSDIRYRSERDKKSRGKIERKNGREKRKEEKIEKRYQKDHIIEPNNKKKKYLNPEDPRDAEEIMNILENLSDDDEICSEIYKADDLNLILLPPQDGQDSDCDDAPSDDERLTNFRDIGKGVLLQPLEVQAITRSEQIKNKTDVLVQPSTSSESNNGAEQVQRDKRIPRQWLSKELDFSVDEEEKFTTTIPELFMNDGYVIKFNPYTGAGDKEQGKSLGATVTEQLCIGFLPPRSAVFIDNYFNSLPLLDTLKNHEIFCVGTIRKDRVERAPLKDMKKLPRGSHYVLQNDGLTLIQWHDNSQVTVATNLDTNDTLSKGTCNRWSKKEGKLIAVPQPTLIQLYNKGMGGTRIRSKKWYWPLYRFCLDGSIVNLWLIYRQHNKVNLVEFRRSIALALLTSPDMETRRGPQPKTKRQVSNEVRRDNTGHLVNKIESQRSNKSLNVGGYMYNLILKNESDKKFRTTSLEAVSEGETLTVNTVPSPSDNNKPFPESGKSPGSCNNICERDSQV
ncbi:hypothetical protein C0J52_05820 [Blattella germanica]|nr:hypothetical protein C0J52_05820 [Blattella germanica]